MLTQRGFAIDYTTEHDLGNPTYPVTLFALDETIDKKKDLLVRYFRAQGQGLEVVRRETRGDRQG